MNQLGEARRRLREAMKRYGFTDRDRVNWPGHVTDGTDCWCRPDRLCGLCDSRGPCIHGPDRVEILVHREAS